MIADVLPSRKSGDYISVLAVRAQASSLVGDADPSFAKAISERSVSDLTESRNVVNV